VTDGGQFGIAGNELLTVNAAGTFAFSGISGVTVEDGDWIGNGAATARLTFDSSGATDYAYFSGCYVGIGITVPIQEFNVHGSYGDPATSGTVQNGIAAFSVIETYSTLYVGSATANPFAMWMQASRRNDLSVNHPISLNPNGGNVGIGMMAPIAQCHIDQSSATGAQPVLLLDQADLSEEFIEFTSTVGAGYPIDTAAIGTYYGKIRVNVTGVGYKYIALYNS
jgi:hypothetical protein